MDEEEEIIDEEYLDPLMVDELQGVMQSLGILGGLENLQERLANNPDL